VAFRGLGFGSDDGRGKLEFLVSFVEVWCLGVRWSKFGTGSAGMFYCRRNGWRLVDLMLT
jgi:hypothetical protein